MKPENDHDFRPIPSLNGKYEINPSGTVRNAKTKYTLTIHTPVNLRHVKISVNGSSRWFGVDKLLQEVFGTPLPARPAALPCTIEKDGETHYFDSFTACAMFLASYGPMSMHGVRGSLSKRRLHINGWNVQYPASTLDPEKEEKKKATLLDCWHCGKEFYSYSPVAKFCSTECRDAAKAKKARKAATKKRKKPRKPLDEWIKEANACGMHYGAYRAAIEQLGKTFEELKLQGESV